MAASFGLWWIAHKGALVTALGLSRDLLHLAIGGLAFAVLLGVLRSRAGAWCAVLAIELTNEAGDLITGLALSGDARIGDTVSDIALTLLVPTILWSWLVAIDAWFPRAHRRLGATRRRRRAGRRRAARPAVLPA
ncbi:hypothetical protein [Sphingomonas adhaesiva]|uniref:hypothetical protein n=1 Tax=Sphingomonas adhaesiva TaxID=28212 RepID=UPI002FFB8176